MTPAAHRDLVRLFFRQRCADDRSLGIPITRAWQRRSAHE